MVVGFLLANNVNIRDLCRDVCRSLELGRGPTVPVLVLAGARGGEGKSVFLKPLFSVFGHAHVLQPIESDKFPLVDINGKKMAFLDEWRFNEEVISWAAQCRWSRSYE